MSAHIKIDAIEKSFTTAGDTSVAVAAVNVEIQRGEIFCLLGPSGCGKTTLLNMIAGFERPTKGALTITDRPITRPGPDRGVIFQSDTALFGWLTTLENVTFGPRMKGEAAKASEAKARDLIALVGLKGAESKYPRELSGGMKQRVQLARALANDPEVLLMDEPFGALDAQTRRVMQREVLKIWRETGKTIVMVTHDIDEAIVMADRIGVMSAGPGRLDTVIDVDFPRPRVRDAAFGALFERIDGLLAGVH